MQSRWNLTKTINSYNITNKSRIFLILRLRGGGTFADVSKRLVAGRWTTDAPQWRVCSNGLNFETGCSNALCVASNMRVVHPHGYGTFDLLNHEMNCPMCKSTLIASNFIVTNADLTIIGKKKNTEYINQTLKITTDPHYPPTNEQEEYEYLVAHCTPPETIATCKLCFVPKPLKHFKQCEHLVCAECLQPWELVFSSCPVCMLHV